MAKFAQSSPMLAGAIVRPSLTENLQHERERLVRRMAEIDEVLTAMRENPAVEKVIDLIFKQGIR